MRLFFILVRFIGVGAIVIVSSAVYIANAQALPNISRVTAIQCPETHTDGIDAYTFILGATRCMRIEGAGYVYSIPVNDGVLVTAYATCSEEQQRFAVFKLSNGEIRTVCALADGTSVTLPYGSGLTVERTNAEIIRALLIIANVFVFLAAISFGWRMAIRPPVGLME